VYVENNKQLFREKGPHCYICQYEREQESKQSGGTTGAGASADLEEVIITEQTTLEGKARKRQKQRYQVWVHIIEARGLKSVGKDAYVNPVAYVTCFGQTFKTKVGDKGKTYSCVWDAPFHFELEMDEEQFGRENLKVRIENSGWVWNDMLGSASFQLETVRKQPNHEFYREWWPVTHVGHTDKTAAGKTRAISEQGKMRISVCCFNAKDRELKPEIPIHQYNLEVQMWDDLEHLKEVQDYDFDKKYLQRKLDDYNEDEKKLISDVWDVIHFKVYRGEYLPKTDTNGWCDGYVEVKYEGLLDKNKSMKTGVEKEKATPVWNHEFCIPVPAGKTVPYDRIDMTVFDKNKLHADEVVGKTFFRVSDILNNAAENPSANLPQWINVYIDRDGEAPRFRGRVMVEFEVERGVKMPNISSKPCGPCPQHLTPATGTYKLDLEVFEGVQLGSAKKYVVDVTWGHSMSVDDHRVGGILWESFDSSSKQPDNVHEFLQRKTLQVYNLPIPAGLKPPPKVVEAIPDPTKTTDGTIAVLEGEGTKDGAATTKDRTVAEVKSDADGTAKDGAIKKTDAGKGADATKGTTTTAGATPAPKVLTEAEKKEETKLSKAAEERAAALAAAAYRNHLPDIIIYVYEAAAGDSATSKERGACIGYLRIPLNNKKRPTEQWEDGQDLTVFPNLWDGEGESCARCLPLKPLEELYDTPSSFLLVRLRVLPISEGQASVGHRVIEKVEALPRVERQRYKFVARVYQGKHLGSVDSSGLSNPMSVVQLMNSVLKSRTKEKTCYPNWFETLENKSLVLPVNLRYAPNISVTIYHNKGIVHVGDRKIFMGKAEVEAFSALQVGKEQPRPKWYPLEFEELTYGEVLCSFQLIPYTQVELADSLTVIDMNEMINGWDQYKVEISALAVRGLLATDFEKRRGKITYSIECWDDVQEFTENDNNAALNKLTVTLRKPKDDIFYASVNIRVLHGKELKAVTSIPLDKILPGPRSWDKALKLAFRDPKWIAKKYAIRWRYYTKHHKGRELIKAAAKARAAADKKQKPSTLHWASTPSSPRAAAMTAPSSCSACC